MRHKRINQKKETNPKEEHSHDWIATGNELHALFHSRYMPRIQFPSICT